MVNSRVPGCFFSSQNITTGCNKVIQPRILRSQLLNLHLQIFDSRISRTELALRLFKLLLKFCNVSGSL